MPRARTPSAFEDCPQWAEFEKRLDEHGIRRQILDEWRVRDRKTRGGNFRKLAFYAADGSFITLAIAEAHADKGFGVWFIDRGNSISGTVDRILEIAKDRAETLARTRQKVDEAIATLPKAKA